MYKVRPIRITHNFSIKSPKIKRAWIYVFQSSKRLHSLAQITIVGKPFNHHKWRR